MVVAVMVAVIATKSGRSSGGASPAAIISGPTTTTAKIVFIGVPVDGSGKSDSCRMVSPATISKYIPNPTCKTSPLDTSNVGDMISAFPDWESQDPGSQHRIEINLMINSDIFQMDTVQNAFLSFHTVINQPHAVPSLVQGPGDDATVITGRMQGFSEPLIDSELIAHRGNAALDVTASGFSTAEEAEQAATDVVRDAWQSLIVK
ncbi:hypothetical protein ACWDUL_20420 [Nocardia niigatensis]